MCAILHVCLLKTAKDTSVGTIYRVWPSYIRIGTLLQPQVAFSPFQLILARFIVDGINSGNLNGLDVFLRGTDERTDPESPRLAWRGFPGDRCDDVYVPQRYHGADWPKRGPNDGDTQCSWCTINWFDRKLGSWEEGKVRDPVNGTVVTLPTYLRTIENAGRRCQTSDWERIFRKNVWKYQELGWFPDDWEGDRGGSRSGPAGHSRPSWSVYEDDVEAEIAARLRAQLDF